jgi:O-methyltransferase involved in polyketide biosynthesis
VFGWQPPRRYDTVFFAFWLTHVPPARFAAFWSQVGAALAPGGRVCFVDDTDRERAGERVVPEQATPAVWRRLRDGSEHRVVKVPAELADRLAELGWSASITRPAPRCSSGPPAGSATPAGVPEAGLVQVCRLHGAASVRR